MSDSYGWLSHQGVLNIRDNNRIECDASYPYKAEDGKCLFDRIKNDVNGGDYWLIKKSWWTTWGEQGYIRMARNRNNNCGIGMFSVYPVVWLL